MKRVLFMMLLVFAGCAGLRQHDSGLIQSYGSPVIEAAWIRNGQPLIFENHEWYPVDDTETLLDNEVFQVGEYQGVAVFVEKIDARPYDRLYTKFAKGRFRYYLRAEHD